MSESWNERDAFKAHGTIPPCSKNEDTFHTYWYFFSCLRICIDYRRYYSAASLYTTWKNHSIIIDKKNAKNSPHLSTQTSNVTNVYFSRPWRVVVAQVTNHLVSREYSFVIVVGRSFLNRPSAVFWSLILRTQPAAVFPLDCCSLLFYRWCFVVFYLKRSILALVRIRCVITYGRLDSILDWK